jgi:hypothetical protein
MNKLSLVKQQVTEEGYVTLDQLLGLLGPDDFDAIDAKIKRMRESYQCPYTVRDYQEFKATLFDFWAHYHKAWLNVDWKSIGGMCDLTKQQAYQFIEQHLGGYREILAAERNAIAGREGGMIAVIDKITEALTKFQIESYIRSVFFELIRASDYETRMRLAEELLKKYGPLLFPGEKLVPFYVLGYDLESFDSSEESVGEFWLREFAK